VKFSTKTSCDNGSAIIDLIGFGVLLQIPVLMFATAAISTQHQSFALEAIARHAIRAHTLWPDKQNTSQVVKQLASDFGLAYSSLEWELSCRPDPECKKADSIATIEVKLGQLSARAIHGL
jgi:hypothetical protein